MGIETRALAILARVRKEITALVTGELPSVLHGAIDHYLAYTRTGRDDLAERETEAIELIYLLGDIYWSLLLARDLISRSNWGMRAEEHEHCD